jgi:uncharacterized membrane protein
VNTASLSNYKRIALAVSLLLPAFLILALPLYKPGDMPYLMLMIGRFHPVVLHFPIVLIILALILELLRRTKFIMKSDLVVTIVLIAAAVTTVVAIASGYLLYASGDYSGTLLRRHLWIGVITGVCILITVLLFFLFRHTRYSMLYFIGLLTSNAAVAYTSHLGGALTHGEDYLTEYVPLIKAKQGDERIKPESQMTVYEDMIAPVFEAKCVSCHNESKAKGELSMAGYSNFLKKGESGIPAVIPGNADSSELYRRLLLPEEDEDRMPPKGKTPLTGAETELVRFWIASGAKTNLLVQNVRKDPDIHATVNTILPELKRYRRKMQIAKLKNEQLKRDLDTVARQLNIRIQTDTTADENFYTVAMKFPPAPFTNQQFRELAPYAAVFSKLSLVASGIEDDGLYYISHMTNLKALYLQKTKLNGSGLVYLKDLLNLEVLNLSYTQVDDKAVLDLLKIPALREVYLFQTKASPQVIKALQEYKPSLKILLEEGPYL